MRSYTQYIRESIDIPEDGFPQDERRHLTWNEIEAKVQKVAPQKDASFRLNGPWKTYLKDQDGYRVFMVDGDWVRVNLSIIFGHGAHGYVHEFCPHDEIWIDRCHREDCCTGTRPGDRCTEAFVESTIAHEILEHQEMGKGKPYWTAHNMALRHERALGYLEDPYSDRPTAEGGKSH